MFRAMISPIFRSSRLCDTVCGIIHPLQCGPVTWKLRFQATGRNIVGALYHKL